MECFYFEKLKENMQLYLAIYDIADDKKRKKMAKLLEGYGKRVQLSAFELNISPVMHRKLVQKIPLYIDSGDSFRLYLIHSGDNVQQWGIKFNNMKCDVLVV